MKITKFDPNYPWRLGDTTLAQGGGVSVPTGDSGSTGGSSGAAGGDLAGALPDPTVVGIQGTPVDALPAIATEYLDGTGHWSTPPGSGTGYVTNIGGGKEVINTIAASGASHALDLSLGNVQDLTLTASCTLTFSGATAGVFCSFELFLRQDGTGGWATTWPGSVVWPGGSAPTLDTTPSNLTVLAFGSEDGGTTWYGFPSHGSGSGSLEVKEVDGSPDVTGVTIIRVSNGTLTNDGGGQVTIVTGSGGGGGATGVRYPLQFGSINNGSGGTRVITLGATPTNGNLLLLISGVEDNGSITSITQTNVTWTKFAGTTIGSAPVVEIWKGVVGASAGTGLTVAYSSSAYGSCAVIEMSGLTGTLDQSATRSDNFMPIITPSTSGAFSLFGVCQDAYGAYYAGFSGSYMMSIPGSVTGAYFGFQGVNPAFGVALRTDPHTGTLHAIAVSLT